MGHSGRHSNFGGCLNSSYWRRIMDDIGAGRMQLMEYILVERDQFDDLKMRGGATAEHLLRAIAEWDAAGHCINCKDAPLPAPEAFIVISSGSEIYAAGICARCADA